MKNLEIKKNKGLKLNFTILILFSIHLFSILIAFKTTDFQVNKYPLARILDSYLAISLFFNPLALSSLVKKVIEIEEKNNMWQMQISLGLRVQKILLNKIKTLSLKILLIQILEWLLIIFLSSKSKNFNLDIDLIKRIVIYFLTTLSINISMLLIFTIIEIKSKKIYFSLFFSIVGAMSGIITMLTSKVLSQINPFGLFATILNINYVKDGEIFRQTMNNINYLTLLISLFYIFLALIYILKNNKFRLSKEV
ncbi:ABC transporter permease [Peptoniphilus grossensis]|uniref:ABC transporter permease n=1 Tax=Peptoniphilus grossensis TaxID=1465756 RepID=UPI0002E129EC|nr:ABC transporter permease [Peptoniphilus grossensis]